MIKRVGVLILFFCHPLMADLDPDFFYSQKGLLAEADSGQYACTSVWGENPRSESLRMGNAVQKFCKDTPTIRWVPASTNTLNRTDGTSVQGYYQICCYKKAEIQTRARR